MSKFEVTNQDFCAFLNDKGNQTEAGQRWLALFTEDYYDITESNGRFTVKSGRNRRPICNVSWYGATAYGVWLSAKTSKSYRLPTEAEWEFSARGGESFKFAGSDNLEDVAWARSNSGNRAHDVGTKQGNGFGLYDMTGNVWEWCSDWYKGYPGSTGVNDFTRSNRVFRGSSWGEGDEDCLIADRSSSAPAITYGHVGFRVCYSLQ